MTRAVWLVLVGIASVQLGAGVAKDLFTTIPPTVMVFLRLATSTLVFLAIARPGLRGRSGADWRAVAGFGLTLAIMNWAIYQSFARIPLGIAVTIEFIGPLSLAVWGSRRPRDLVWAALAAAGVLLLGAEPADLDVAGVAFAVLAGASWAAYILLARDTGRRWQGLDGLAVASALATVLVAPLALNVGGTGLVDGRVLALGALVGLLSSVVPYSCEMAALRTIPPGLFGILMSVEPAAAALVALAVLGEALGVAQWLAIACVVAASAGATMAAAGRRARPT